MEKELNYLSKKIEEINTAKDIAEQFLELNGDNSLSGQDYVIQLIANTNELEMLENILNKLTIDELN
jgi:hypothetical protein